MKRHLSSRWFYAVGVVVLAGIVTACQPSQPGFSKHIVPIYQIPVPQGSYIGTAWLQDDQLVVQHNPDPEARTPGSYLFSVLADGSNLRRLDLPPDDRYDCTVTFFRNPMRLPTGNLAFERECATSNGFHASLLYWEPGTTASGLLYGYDLPTAQAVFTFSPDLSDAILSSTSGIEDHLYRLQAETFSLMDLGLARAYAPAWSPNGQSIVFFGNRSMQGPPGPDWVIQPADIWVIPASCIVETQDCRTSLHSLIQGIQFASRVTWSPDGRWLAFDGILQDWGRGIWLMNVESTLVIQVADGDFIQPEWSPDGQHIVVNGPSASLSQGSPTYRSTLFILDVREAINEGAGNSQ